MSGFCYLALAFGISMLMAYSGHRKQARGIVRRVCGMPILEFLIHGTISDTLSRIPFTASTTHIQSQNREAYLPMRDCSLVAFMILHIHTLLNHLIHHQSWKEHILRASLQFIYLAYIGVSCCTIPTLCTQHESTHQASKFLQDFDRRCQATLTSPPSP
jgi:hypothetical protein